MRAERDCSVRGVTRYRSIGRKGAGKREKGARKQGNGVGKRGGAGKLRKAPESEGTVFERYRKAREECRKARDGV